MNETGIGNSLTFLCDHLVASLRLAVPLVAALVRKKDKSTPQVDEEFLAWNKRVGKAESRWESEGEQDKGTRGLE